jgi:hypothetical protein
MAKKSSAPVAAPVKARKPNAEESALSPTRLRDSSLLDTRVVYCGDNLEQQERRKKEEGRMMKPAHSPILHSSFILLNFPVSLYHAARTFFQGQSSL